MRQALLNIFSLRRPSSRGLKHGSSTPTMSAARPPSTPSGTTGAPGRMQGSVWLRAPENKLKRSSPASSSGHGGGFEHGSTRLQDAIRQEVVGSWENVTEVDFRQESAEVHDGSAPQANTSTASEKRSRMQAHALMGLLLFGSS